MTDRLEFDAADYFVSIEGRSQITEDAVATRTGLSGDDLRQFPHPAVGSVDAVR